MIRLSYEKTAQIKYYTIFVRDVRQTADYINKLLFMIILTFDKKISLKHRLCTLSGVDVSPNFLVAHRATNWHLLVAREKSGSPKKCFSVFKPSYNQTMWTMLSYIRKNRLLVLWTNKLIESHTHRFKDKYKLCMIWTIVFCTQYHHSFTSL